MTQVKFIPKTDIPVIKNFGFGPQLGIISKGLDYTADNFVELDGKITFTLNDEQGWIGDYQTESQCFFVDYVIDELVESNTMKQEKTYDIELFLYSDELYPEDYVDGQVNGYNLNQKQYEKFKSIVFTDVEEIHEWCMKNLESDNKR